ncbi:MAG: 2-oxoacid:acceptor oxidoreductase family protein, partial [Thermoanaerobaculia bacterium]|nr:2-oxoacid:acceptor oxidoreductase family protein [Thermoanaerobaculia bacterium]
MTTTPPSAPTPARTLDPEHLESVVIRFSGDSGDGMQLAGGQFAATSAILGNDIATFPDFPAEIRAPKGTTFGVSGFQLQFSSTDIHTPGDMVNALIAMNPAGLKVNLADVASGGIVIANADEFNDVNLKKCGYPEGYSPLNDEQINTSYQVFAVPMSRLTREALADAQMSVKEIDRCRNMFALGVAYWLFERDIDATVEHVNEYYGVAKKRPDVADANIKVLKAGYYFGENAELFPARYRVPPAQLKAGAYRQI